MESLRISPDEESFEEMRRRALIMAGLFLAVHSLYTAFQLVCLLAIPMPPAIDAGVLRTSFFVNLALDVGMTAYLLFVVVTPRFGRNPFRALHVATVVASLLLMTVWAVQAHFGGSQSSHMLAVVLGTVVVVAWFVPWRTVVALAVATAGILVALVVLEINGTVPYSPLLSIGEEARAVYLDWRVVLMNGAIFLCTFVAVVAILLRMRVALRRGRTDLRRSLVHLEREVAERERAQQTLRRAVEELTSRNEALRGFIRGTAHDLRSPLTAMGGFASLARADLADGGGKSLQHLDRVEDGVRHMARLLDDLGRLVLTEPGQVALAPCDSAAVVERVAGFLDIAIRDAGARVERGELPVVLADESRLTQVFQNLVGNALKFRSEAPPVVRVGATRVGGTWRFTVRDNGIGFDPGARERLFEPFERLAPPGRYEGNGIGLSVCRMLVRSMDGSIGADPLPEGGSEFWFTLQAVPGS
jgi:signal transduction histidine kinase